MNNTEKRARELSAAVRAISNRPLPAKAPRSITFVSKQESAVGTPGRDGRDAEVDMDAIYDTILARLKKEKSLVVSDLSDGQAFVFNNTKYKTHEMMHGAGGAGASSTSVYSEVVSGSGTSWTLAHAPSSGTLQLYGNGQRLTLTVDFSITGAAITTVNSFSAGTIIADYQYT